MPVEEGLGIIMDLEEAIIMDFEEQAALQTLTVLVT
jgi:hypothetical protein